jgi:hypothetical protein
MKTIVGRRIVEVRPMTRPEASREGWEPGRYPITTRTGSSSPTSTLRAKWSRAGWTWSCTTGQQARSPGEATVLVLDDGTILYPSRDDEGNGPGALFGADRDGELFTVSATNWT